MSHMAESCNIWMRRATYECVISHVNESIHWWMSPHMNDTWDDLCMSPHIHMWTHVNESPHMWTSPFQYEWIMPHLNVLCLTRMSRVTYEWVTSHVNESCHIWISHVTYECVMLHTNESRHIWISHVTYECIISHIYVMPSILFHILGLPVSLSLSHVLSVSLSLCSLSLPLPLSFPFSLSLSFSRSVSVSLFLSLSLSHLFSSLSCVLPCFHVHASACSCMLFFSRTHERHRARQIYYTHQNFLEKPRFKSYWKPPPPSINSGQAERKRTWQGWVCWRSWVMLTKGITRADRNNIAWMNLVWGNTKRSSNFGHSKAHTSYTHTSSTQVNALGLSHTLSFFLTLSLPPPPPPPPSLHLARAPFLLLICSLATAGEWL